MNVRTTAALFIGSLLFAVGCGDDDRPPVGDSTSSGPHSESDGGTVATEPDGSISNPALCTGLTLGGDAVAERERVGTLPEPVGGELLEGTYDLTELTSYIPSNPDCTTPGTPPDEGGEPDDDCPRLRRTDRVAQVTLVVTPYAIQRIEATGVETVGAPTMRAVVYKKDGSSLSTTALCPEGGTKGTTPYSASGAALTLFVDGKEEQFVRRP